MSELELSRINETSYLNADNASRYRAIMRVFFHADERMRNSLYQEDVLGLLRDEFPFYQDLDPSLLKQDLAQLVTWGNLEAVQDPKHVYTIAEYKNKRFRYSITPAAVEVERMVWRLENLQLQSSSLSSNYFLRLENQLKELEHVMTPQLQAAASCLKKDQLAGYQEKLIPLMLEDIGNLTSLKESGEKK